MILADIYGQALAQNGFTVTYKLNIGARAAYIPALESGEVNLIPEYSGSILDFLEQVRDRELAVGRQGRTRQGAPVDAQGAHAVDRCRLRLAQRDAGVREGQQPHVDR